MKIKQGKEFYAKRKSTVEPVIGIIKEAMGFFHFMLRDIEAVKGPKLMKNWVFFTSIKRFLTKIVILIGSFEK